MCTLFFVKTMKAENLEEIYSEFSGRIKAYLSGKVRSSEDAEDLTQEIFIKIQRNIESLKDEKKLAPWIHSIVRNSITDYYRRKDMGSVEIDDNISYEEDGESENGMQDIVYCLNVFMDRLPEKYREPLVLSDIEGIKQKDLANRMGLSYTGLKSRVQRGREMIKNMFMNCCGVPDSVSSAVPDDCLDHDDCEICNPPEVT